MEIYVAKGSREYSTTHFTVQYETAVEKSGKDIVQTILSDVDAARVILDKAFRHDPSKRIPLLIYSDETFLRFVGHDNVTGLFHPYDGVIRLRFRGLEGPERVRFRATVFHEYAHALMHSMTGGRLTDRWLHEGLAEWSEQFSGHDVLKGISREDRNALAASVPVFRLMDMDRYENYLRARIVVDEIMRAFGTVKLLEVLSEMGDGKYLDTAMLSALGRDYVTVEKFIRKRLR
jgi:hypothetical protein